MVYLVQLLVCLVSRLERTTYHSPYFIIKVHARVGITLLLQLAYELVGIDFRHLAGQHDTIAGNGCLRCCGLRLGGGGCLR